MITVVQLIIGDGPRSDATIDPTQPSTRTIETVASVMRFDASEAFGVIDGVTVGSATLALDDGRILNSTGDTPGRSIALIAPHPRRACYWPTPKNVTRGLSTTPSSSVIVADLLSSDG